MSLCSGWWDTLTLHAGIEHAPLHPCPLKSLHYRVLVPFTPSYPCILLCSHPYAIVSSYSCALQPSHPSAVMTMKPHGLVPSCPCTLTPLHPRTFAHSHPTSHLVKLSLSVICLLPFVWFSVGEINCSFSKEQRTPLCVCVRHGITAQKKNSIPSSPSLI